MRINALAAAAVAFTLCGCPSGESAPPPKPKPNPAGSTPVSAGNKVKVKAALMGVLNAARAYKAEKGRIPKTMQELVDGDYLTAKTAKDLWGNDWVVQEKGPKVVVLTYGADGKPGGEGPDTDWSSEDL